MIILILALIFGVAVFIFTLTRFNKAKAQGNDSKVVKALRLLVLFEALVYIAIFVFVFIKTLFMG
ncbi:MAG: hypothetical protein Q4B18_05925 [Bacillota bacterium]|nr:hypothetical protein [Bacillota bacterium]